MSTFGLIFVLLQKYLVPAIFVIGLVFFVYGIIQYFIIGQHSGDEERKQVGRDNLLRGTSWFMIGLLIYAFVAFVGWMAAVRIGIADGDASAEVEADAGARVEETRATLPVPNAPDENFDSE